MNFTLNEKELENLDKFKQALEVIFCESEFDVLKGRFTYCFTPTEIGDVIDVLYEHVDGKCFKKDITDVEKY